MNPVLEEWSLYFEIKHGLENREQILKAVWELISNPERHEMLIPDGFSCRAGGIIHGSEQFDDGAMIMTSPIKKLVKGSTIISSDGDIYTTVIISSSDKKNQRCHGKRACVCPVLRGQIKVLSTDAR